MMAEGSTVPYCHLKDEESCDFEIIVMPQLPQTRDLLQELVGKPSSSLEEESSDDMRLPWTLSTKYYTCQLSILLTDSVQQLPATENLGAIIVYFEPDQKESWVKTRNLETWIKEQVKHGVKLLVCNGVSDKSAVQKTEVLSWCLDHEFELIDLDEPAEDEYDVTGVARIKQSLAAHSWPNLVMKEKPDMPSDYMKQLRNDVLRDEAASHTATGLLDDSLVNSAINEGGENGVESFEKLFSELSFMKGKATQLSPTSRKEYAEKVAMSFLSALGDESEDSD